MHAANDTQARGADASAALHRYCTVISQHFLLPFDNKRCCLSWKHLAVVGGCRWPARGWRC